MLIKKSKAWAVCSVCGVQNKKVKARYTTGKGGGKLVGIFCPDHQREK
jgi:hypothetical protein